MKRFLKIRDTSPLYDEVRARGAIGLPTIVMDDEVMIGFEKEQIDRLID